MTRRPVEGDEASSKPWLNPLDAGMTFGLFVPLALALVAVKGWQVSHLPMDLSVWVYVDLLRSDLFFYGGLLLAQLALHARFPVGPPSWAVRGAVVGAWAVVSFTAILVGNLFAVTGTVLDWSLFRYATGKIGQYLVVVSSEGSPVAWTVAIVLAAVLLFAGLLRSSRRADEVARELAAAPRRRAWSNRFAGGAVALALLSQLPPLNTSLPWSLSRQSLAHITWTFLRPGLDVTPHDIARAEPYQSPVITVPPEERPANVVIIVLESTRARSTTLHDPELGTTPFLAELAARSLVATRAWAVVPHTTKSMPPINCGIEPLLSIDVRESEPGNIPVSCLPHLLGDLGYRSVFFRSATEHFEGWRGLVANLGYDDFIPLEEMDRTGFEPANYFGYEDAIMLEPSERWLRQHGTEPFLALYLTGTPHHDYLAPTRYGHHDFASEPILNRYLNSIWYLDNFLRELFEQYQRLGLYEDSLFVVVADHGEGFGEHIEKQHNACPYEESLHVPMLFHFPAGVLPGVVTAPTNHLDIVPTVADALGLQLDRGSLTGASLLGEVPPDRTLFASCWFDNACLALTRGPWKLIHFFDDRPDELYHLEDDPWERHNLAAANPGLAAELREDLLAWFVGTKARYLRFLQEGGGGPVVAGP